MINPFDQPCGCSDCEAAVSPAAYLAALLDYALKHVRSHKAAIDLPFLVDTFHQPIADLPTDCGAVERQLRQARICVEALRRYLGSRPLADAGKEAALAKAEEEYRVAAYAMLLTRVGSSFEEIRRVRAETDGNRQAVAGRLGIDLTEPRPDDELDRLFLDPTAGAPSGRLLTEGALEALFGLADTTRDPLSHVAAIGDDNAQITRWTLRGVRWGQNTGPDGSIYVTLVNPAPAVFRVELHQDASRTTLIASGEIATAQGTVKLVPESNSRLSGSCLLAYTADSRAISIAAVPALSSWRLQHVRALWSAQDHPRDAYSDGAPDRRPIVDPDVIGPDDFRHPAPKTSGPDQAFDLWLARRQFVDMTLSSLKAAREAKGLDEILGQVLGSPIPDIDGLLAVFTTGATSAELAAAGATVTALHLSVESFTRLMAVRGKDRAAMDDARHEKVSDAEWLEVYAILAQAVKEAKSAVWRTEEGSGVALDLHAFWPSMTEPKEGDWPPSPVAAHPLIDPDIVKLTDLPDWLAGKDAIALWHARKAQVGQTPAVLEAERGAKGVDAMLRLALGHPAAGNPLQHDAGALLKDLGSLTKADRDAAAVRIVSDLHMTVEAFKRVMEIKAASDQRDPNKKPFAADWAEAFALLTPAHKTKHLYPAWVLQENAGGLVYWKALKARLPRWLSSADARQAWQRALRVRGQPPIIDPAAMGPDDLQRVIPGDAAFDLWKTRADRAAALHAQLKAAREALDPDAVKGLEQVLNDAIGFGAADLSSLDEQREAGQSIERRLEQLTLVPGSFSYLRRIGHLAAAKQPITDAEWETVYATLTHATLRRDSAGLRAEEELARITLGPDWFRIPEAVLTPLPFLDPFAPRWLSTAQSRREWQGTLQSRMDQEGSIGQALRNVVDAVEEEMLPVLRDALIVASDAAGTSFAERAEWITARLLLDARTDGCAMTTRVAQAIETLQTLIFNLRTGQFRQLSSSPLSVVSDDFAEEWTWIGSYATWRCAMFVSLYPENVLQPSLLRSRTPAFSHLVKTTRGLRIDAAAACQHAEAYAAYFRDVCSLDIQATCQASTIVYSGEGCARQPATARSMFYMFARAASGKIYWSACDPASSAGQTYWDEVKVFGDAHATVHRIAGAMPYRASVADNPKLSVAGDPRNAAVSAYIHVFCVTGEAGRQTLQLARLNLDDFGAWDANPYPLATPLPITADMNIVPVQTQSEFTRPGLVFHRADSRQFYLRTLNRDGTAWEPSPTDWAAFLNEHPTPGPGWKEIRAVLYVQRDHWFVTLEPQNHYNAAVYRLSGRGKPIAQVVTIAGVADAVFGALPGPEATGALAAAASGFDSEFFLFAQRSDGIGYTRITNPTSNQPFHATLSDLVRIAPGSGRAEAGHTMLAYERRKNDHASYIYRYTVAGSSLQGAATIRAVPRAQTALSVPTHMTAAGLQQRRKDIRAVFALNADGSASVLQYLREAYYFVPFHLALALQSAGQYLASVDCYRTIYDYDANLAPTNERNIYYGLDLDAQLPDVPLYEQANNWLLDPLNPHAIAATRRYSYTRATITCLARCLIDFADSEFTRDTGESLAGARTLYLTAMSLLDLPELHQQLGACDALIAELRIQPGKDIPPEVPAAVAALMEDLTAAGLGGSTTLLNNMEATLAGAGSWTLKLAAARTQLEAARASVPLPKSTGTMVTAAADTLKDKHARLLMDATLDVAVQDAGRAVSATAVRS